MLKDGSVPAVCDQTSNLETVIFMCEKNFVFD